MESAHWRSYRRHLIIARKTFLGRRRYDVWKRGRLIETFGDVVDAELHIDDAIEQQAGVDDRADPTARELLATLTACERTMLEAIAHGRSLKETARALGLSTRDAQALKTGLFGKIGAGSTADALRVGRYGGMAEQPADQREQTLPSGRER